MELGCSFGKATGKEYNKLVRLQVRAKEQPLTLMYQRLGEPEDLTVVVYGDAAHASLPDNVSSARASWC